MKIALYHPSGAENIVVAPKFSKNYCISGLPVAI